jgi:hypothetical protein
MYIVHSILLSLITFKKATCKVSRDTNNLAGLEPVRNHLDLHYFDFTSYL